MTIKKKVFQAVLIINYCLLYTVKIKIKKLKC